MRTEPTQRISADRNAARTALTVTSILRAEGVRGLYQGLMPAIYGNAIRGDSAARVHQRFPSELNLRFADNSAPSTHAEPFAVTVLGRLGWVLLFV